MINPRAAELLAAYRADEAENDGDGSPSPDGANARGTSRAASPDDAGRAEVHTEGTRRRTRAARGHATDSEPVRLGDSGSDEPPKRSGPDGKRNAGKPKSAKPGGISPEARSAIVGLLRHVAEALGVRTFEGPLRANEDTQPLQDAAVFLIGAVAGGANLAVTALTVDGAQSQAWDLDEHETQVLAAYLVKRAYKAAWLAALLRAAARTSDAGEVGSILLGHLFATMAHWQMHGRKPVGAAVAGRIAATRAQAQSRGRGRGMPQPQPQPQPQPVPQPSSGPAAPLMPVMPSAVPFGQ